MLIAGTVYMVIELKWVSAAMRKAGGLALKESELYKAKEVIFQTFFAQQAAYELCRCMLGIAWVGERFVRTARISHDIVAIETTPEVIRLARQRFPHSAIKENRGVEMSLLRVADLNDLNEFFSDLGNALYRGTDGNLLVNPERHEKAVERLFHWMFLALYRAGVSNTDFIASETISSTMEHHFGLDADADGASQAYLLKKTYTKSAYKRTGVKSKHGVLRIRGGCPDYANSECVAGNSTIS